MIRESKEKENLEEILHQAIDNLFAYSYTGIKEEMFRVLGPLPETPYDADLEIIVQMAKKVDKELVPKIFQLEPLTEEEKEKLGQVVKDLFFELTNFGLHVQYFFGNYYGFLDALHQHITGRDFLSELKKNQ